MESVDPRIERVSRFFSGTGATYDWMVNVATFGIDRRWKRKIVGLVPPESKRILDLACGTGIVTVALAERYPACQIVGVELREEYLSLGRRKIQQRGIANVELVLSRAEEYRSNDRFDCVLSSYLAKYADLKSLTHTSKSMLKDGGLLLMHDFTYPPHAWLRWVFHLYFFLLQRLGTRLCPAWREIFYGLPALIQETRWTSELTEALQANGFREIRMEYLTACGSVIVTARK